MSNKLNNVVLALPPKEKARWERLLELGLTQEEVHSAFTSSLQIRDMLEQAPAKDFVSSLDVDWNNFPLFSHFDLASMMDVDRQVLYWPGMLMCGGGAFGDLELNFDRTVVIDGDLVVDGMFENNCHVLITGDLRCRSLVNTSRHYLIVLGDLKTTGLVSADEDFGTYICGNAEIETAVFVWNHHMGVQGDIKCKVQVHDEYNSEQDVIKVLSDWGHAYPSEDIDLDSIVDALKNLKMPS